MKKMPQKENWWFLLHSKKYTIALLTNIKMHNKDKPSSGVYLDEYILYVVKFIHLLNVCKNNNLPVSLAYTLTYSQTTV